MRILYLPHAYSQQRQFEKPRKIYPVLLAMEAEWHRKKGDEVSWGNPIGKYDKIIYEPEGLPFLELPHPDRNFTRWWEYQDNGNFKYLPATYIQSANGCWYGKCSFCVEKNNKYELRSIYDVNQEIWECGHNGFKEVFDDSGTFPTGKWLEDFCEYKIYTTSAYVHKMPISCNMRLVDVDYKMMKQARFRMLLFGLESANQYTLDKINKRTKAEDVKYIIKAAKTGLEPHIAVMFGFPWETDNDAVRTLKLVHWLLRKGYAKTAQASFYRPQQQNVGNESQRKYIKQIYNVWKYPDFWFNKIRDIHNTDDLKYFWRQIKAGLRKK